MARNKDFAWNLPEGTKQADGSRTHEWPAIHAALLMDIRDELKENNRKLQVVIEQSGWNSVQNRELRGLRRDLKARLKPRCHRAHR